MKPLESTTLPFVVKLNETTEIFDMVSLPMNIYLVCYMCCILLLPAIDFWILTEMDNLHDDNVWCLK